MGDGTLGSVFRGERCDGMFEQTVAIKLLRDGVLSGDAAELFASERHTLARLHHPNIARLLDGGATGSGVPYIVMEYLQGVPITQFAQSRESSTRSRLALFRTACIAVQHAHQNLVAHGDLRPATIRVTAAGVVKVVDFGIARWIRGEPVTAATDIDSLGAVLHELIAGSPPDSSAPSPALNDDLKAIVSKATSPHAEARYTSVADLVDDLDRHLRSKPVRARPATWAYVTGRAIARHRWIFTVVTSAVVAMIAGGIVATFLYLRAERLQGEANVRFNDVRHMARFMLFDLYDRMGRVPGSIDVRRELADRGRVYLENLASIPGASPDVALEAAEGYSRLGEVLGSPVSFNLGQPREAKRNLAVAERMLRALRVRQPGRAELDVELARVLLLQSSITSSMDFDAQKATRLAGAAQQLCDGVLAREPRNVPAMLLRWRSQNALANALGWQNRMPEVIQLMRAQLARGEAIPTDPQWQVERALLEAGSHGNLADALYYTNDLKGSLAEYRLAAGVIEGGRRADAQSPHPLADDPRYLEQLGLIYWNEGGLLSDMNRNAAADEALSKSTEMLERSIAYGSNERTERLLQSVRLQHGLVLSDLGQHANAVALGLASIANRERRLAAQPSDRERHRDLAVGLRPMGDIYASARRRTEACATYRRAEEVWQSIRRDWGVVPFDRDGETKLAHERLATCAPKKAPHEAGL